MTLAIAGPLASDDVEDCAREVELFLRIQLPSDLRISRLRSGFILPVHVKPLPFSGPRSVPEGIAAVTDKPGR